MEGTPDPREPYLYEFLGVKENFGPKIFIKQVPLAPSGLIRSQNTEQDTLNPMVRTPGPGGPYLCELCPPEIFNFFGILGGYPPPLPQWVIVSATRRPPHTIFYTFG